MRDDEIESRLSPLGRYKSRAVPQFKDLAFFDFLRHYDFSEHGEAPPAVASNAARSPLLPAISARRGGCCTARAFLSDEDDTSPVSN